MAGERAGEEGTGRKEGSKLGARRGAPRPREERRANCASPGGKRGAGTNSLISRPRFPTVPEARLKARGEADDGLPGEGWRGLGGRGRSREPAPAGPGAHGAAPARAAGRAPRATRRP